MNNLKKSDKKILMILNCENNQDMRLMYFESHHVSRDLEIPCVIRFHSF